MASPLHDGPLAKVHLDSGTVPYQQRIRAGQHALSADAPKALGGGDTGPTPFGLLTAALASCTSITLQMYAARKGWDLGPIGVDVTFIVEGEKQRTERVITFDPKVTPEQRARLAEIAEKTPVTLAYKRGTPIDTQIK
jgi:putative redox protein